MIPAALTTHVNSRTAGGIWDKLGNRYESLWTVEALMRLLRGEVIELVVEPHGPDGEGVEFYTTSPDGSREYFSAKRQTTGNAWTVADLTRPNETRRSILGDLFARVSSGTVPSRAVFASGSGASKIARLCEEAKSADDAKAFEKQIRGSADLTDEIESHLFKKLGLDWGTAWERLRRLRVDGCDEGTLRRFLERVVERDLLEHSGAKFSPTAARQAIYELVYESFGKPIRRDMIVAHLAKHRLAPRDWHQPGADHDEVERKNRLYTAGVETDLIQDLSVDRKEAQKLIRTIQERTKVVVLTGSAGMGKSCVLAQCLRALEQKNIPCLALRLDAQISACTALALGQDLGLTLSPALVLSGVARGRPSVLIIDQLDALSTASGRNPRLWEAFQDLLFEVEHLQTVQVIVACRSYDLETDDRLRSVIGKKAANPPIQLEPLDVEFVRSTLSKVGAPLEKFFPRHIEFLRTPLHLNVFLRGDPKAASPANDLTMLYDRYWEKKVQRARSATPRVNFEDTVNRLAQAMSERQTLTAPKDVFDTGGLSADAFALASDHVLVLDSGRYRFFHETFFDYVFARQFVAGGRRLVPDLLSPSEQHLFRRGQVRQVLAYQRRRDGSFTAYMGNLRELLSTPTVRTHIKKAVIDWLRDLSDPCVDEWDLILNLFGDPKLGWFARTVAWDNPAWFFVIDQSRTWDRWLSSGDESDIDFAIRLLALPETMKVHSATIAALMRRHLRDTPAWRTRLANLCDFGEIHHSREFFELFLEKLRHGWFDEKSGRHWGLTKIAKTNPAYSGELIAAFLRRRFPACVDETDDNPNAPSGALHLDSHFFQELKKVDPLPVLRQVLPVLVSVLREHERTEEDGRVTDPLRPHHISDDGYRLGDVLIRYLIDAMRQCAKDRPAELAPLANELARLRTETAAILLLATWPSNGAFFAIEAAKFLYASPSRLGLEVRYGFGSSTQLAVAVIQTIADYLSANDFHALESCVLSFTDKWELRNLNYNGQTQYQLLLAFPEARLSAAAWHRLDELRRKFGPVCLSEGSSFSAGFVPSPITLEHAIKMGDRHWLRAMRKYSEKWGSHRRANGRLIGGSVELGRVLEKVAQTDKPRFAKLLCRLPDEVSPTYFEHLLAGLCRTSAENDEERKQLPTSAFASLLPCLLVPCFERVHALPGRPAGKQICWSLKTVAESPVPDSLLNVLVHYAENDPDPEKEIWMQSPERKAPMYGGSPHSHGINSTRGAAAETITQLLFEKPSRWTKLEPTVAALVRDKSLAVRSCSIGCLVFALREHRDEAVGWLLKTVVDGDDILDTHHVERFIHYACFTHYEALRPLLLRMLGLPEEKARSIAARQITLAAFRHPQADSDLKMSVLQSDEVARAAAADIFAHNLKESECASRCREFLGRFFSDSAPKVRQQAGACWRHLPPEQFAHERSLMDIFLTSPGFSSGAEALLHKLEECPTRLPEVVLRIPERLIEEQRRAPEDTRGRIDSAFYDAAKLVLTVYQQSRGHDRGPAAEAFQTRCLNIMDELLPVGHGSMDSELRKLDAA